jgi:pyridinium-3,5-bisthiocarboxylic acid mononucleotide nickel chelatase
VGEAASLDGAGDEVVVVRTTVDHVSGEIIGYAIEALFEKGALDVFTSAVQMKKSRPGVLITVLCPSDRWHDLADVLLRETGSLGARVTRERRVVVPRHLETVRTQWGEARVKVGDGGAPRAVPEYEDARRLARASGHPLRVVLEAITAAYETQRARSS